MTEVTAPGRVRNTNIGGPMRIDIAHVREVLRQRQEINSHKIEDVEWYENGVRREFPAALIEEFRFTGLSTDCFVAFDFWDAEPGHR